MIITEQYTSQLKSLKIKLAQSNQKYVAGSTKNCKGIWRNITSETWILDSITGARIELIDLKEASLCKQKKHFSESEKNVPEGET